MPTTDRDTDSSDYYRAALRDIRIQRQRDLKERLSRKWKPGHGKQRILPGEGDSV
jgi:glutamate formiminotransferase